MTEAERILALSPRQPLNGQRVLRISGFAGRGEMPNSTQIQAVKVGSLNVGTMSGKGREVVVRRYFAYRKHDGGGIRPESWGEALSFSTVEQMEEEGMELE